MQIAGKRARGLSDGQLLALMRSIHRQVKRAYGSPRMHRELRERGYRVGKQRVERLMREQGLRVWQGWLYQAVVLDFFNREVVGWSFKTQLDAELVIDALTMAWLPRRPAAGLIHHSDRGVQYASAPFQSKLAQYQMACSMSRKGNCWDNAPTESFFGSMKNERVHGSRYRTRAQAREDVFQYIEGFYNRSRRHSTLGQISPVQFMHNWMRNNGQKEPA